MVAEPSHPQPTGKDAPSDSATPYPYVRYGASSPASLALHGRLLRHPSLILRSFPTVQPFPQSLPFFKPTNQAAAAGRSTLRRMCRLAALMYSANLSQTMTFLRVVKLFRVLTVRPGGQNQGRPSLDVKPGAVFGRISSWPLRSASEAMVWPETKFRYSFGAVS